MIKVWFTRTCMALALAALILVSERPLYATVTQNAIVTAQTPVMTVTTFVQGTDTAGVYKSIKVGGANGSKIIGIFVTSNDAVLTHLVTVQVSTSASAHCSPQSNCGGGTAVTIPISSGFASAAGAVNMMLAANWPGLPIDSDGNPFLFLTGSSQTLEATYATTPTTSDQLAITVISADF